MSTTLPAQDWEELARFAKQLAKAAAAEILPRFRQPIPVDNKASGAFDPVTEADRAGERAMRALIEAHYPSHGIIGEEYGATPSASGFNWVLDPVDGTRSFIIGVPLWTTLIGLTFEGKPVLGLMAQPFVGESFIGLPNGGGAWWERGDERRKLTVNPARRLADASLTTVGPEPYKTPAQKQVLERLTAATRMTRFGGDAYFYCLLAQGLVDIAMDAGLQSYDIAALVPIITGAGGVVTTFSGGAPDEGGDIIAAASAALHAEALSVISG